MDIEAPSRQEVQQRRVEEFRQRRHGELSLCLRLLQRDDRLGQIGAQGLRAECLGLQLQVTEAAVCRFDLFEGERLRADLLQQVISELFEVAE